MTYNLETGKIVQQHLLNGIYNENGILTKSEIFALQKIQWTSS